MEELKDRMKAIRKEFGLTQKQLAEGLGVRLNTVGCYECGSRAPGAAVVELICRKYGVSRDWLLDGKGEMLITGEHREYDDPIYAVITTYALEPESRQLLEDLVQLSAHQRDALAVIVHDMLPSASKG